MTNKPIILLDCDGPLALFDLTIAQMINPSLTEQNLRELNDWDIFKLFNEEELKRCYSILEDSQFWRNLPVNEHALKAVDKMRKAGGEIFFVTSPWHSCKEWSHARIEWLIKNFNTSIDNIIITKAKQLVYGDVFIDDRLSNIQAWHKQWKHLDKQAILFETNTNFKTDWFPRIVVENQNWRIVENHGE